MARRTKPERRSLVPTTGFEPVTYGLEVRCSIQLSYVGK